MLLPVLVWAAMRLGEPSTPAERPRAPAAAATALVRGPELPADVARLLAQERNWRAARRLRELTTPRSDPELLLVAAKAEAAWGGWDNVFDLLRDKPWLDRIGGGDGWYLLGRAWEQAGQWERAAAGVRQVRVAAAGYGQRAAPRRARRGRACGTRWR